MIVAPSVSDWHKGLVGIERVERCLIGTIFVDPSARLLCFDLKPADFSTPALAAVYEAMMGMKHPDAALVLLRLEKVQPPQGYPGWGTFVSSTIDCACCDDDAVKDYVRAIREAAKDRKSGARAKRRSDET